MNEIYNGLSFYEITLLIVLLLIITIKGKIRTKKTKTE
jgi:hypothetical protein